jgi:hypothetical protein
MPAAAPASRSHRHHDGSAVGAAAAAAATRDMQSPDKQSIAASLITLFITLPALGKQGGQ